MPQRPSASESFRSQRPCEVPHRRRALPGRSRSLQDAGHDAAHVREYGLRAASDGKIFDRAQQEQRVVVSADTDFGTLLANIATIERDLAGGSIVVVEPDRFR
jgi:hypothetical protein